MSSARSSRLVFLVDLKVSSWIINNIWKNGTNLLRLIWCHSKSCTEHINKWLWVFFLRTLVLQMSDIPSYEQQFFSNLACIGKILICFNITCLVRNSFYLAVRCCCLVPATGYQVFEKPARLSCSGDSTWNKNTYGAALVLFVVYQFVAWMRWAGLGQRVCMRTVIGTFDVDYEVKSSNYIRDTSNPS